MVVGDLDNYDGMWWDKNSPAMRDSSPQDLQQLSDWLNQRDGMVATYSPDKFEGVDSKYYLHNNELMRDRTFDTGQGTSMTESMNVMRRPGYRGSDLETRARTVANNPILYGSTSTPMTADRNEFVDNWNEQAARYRAAVGGAMSSAGVGGPLSGSLWDYGQQLMGKHPTVDRGDGGGALKVLCTVYHDLGELSDNLYLADCRNAAKHDPAVRLGYLSWGTPLADWCRKSAVVRAIVKPFVMSWASHMGWLEDCSEGQFNLLGCIMHSIGIPICYIIGKMSGVAAYGLD